jgi:macrolide transport system ATP-binding/permease protein
MQVPVLLGRAIEEGDLAGAPAAVVNEAFVTRALGGRNPLGQRIAVPLECPECEIEIVGVCGNALYGDLTEKAEPTVFLPFNISLWGPLGEMTYELRTAGDPLGYVRAVREIVHRADERLPLAEVKTQSALIDETINQEMTFARLCSAFAFLALAIACVGLYGAMSYGIARRTAEIGIRMALGAQCGRVLWMVLREVLALTAAGLAIGVPAALTASKLIKSFLFGMEPNDPLALSMAVIVLASAAILAAYLPARNASRIDPLVALRHE